MPVHNADLAALFEEIGDRLEIEGANPFRIRAYRNAARQLQAMGVPVADIVAKGEDLSELPGIGEDLAAKIKEIVETGKCQALEKLRKKMPPTVTQLLQIPGLGPKRVRTLYHELDVQTSEQLGRAALDHLYGSCQALASRPKPRSCRRAGNTSIRRPASSSPSRLSTPNRSRNISRRARGW